ncbi:MAG: amino acid permease [Sandaracinaceae bacterium]|nr:amino acid permease [Sandaracinaceae bacterium]
MADLSRLFIKKDLARAVEEASDPHLGEGKAGLRRSLGAFHLTMLGIGAIIGAGIFSITGQAAATYAGPGIVFSFVIGGMLCALAGFCYAELAAMIPIAGSAYTYTYTTMGELIAWIIGWDLVLEYAFGASVVSVAWSGYLVEVIKSVAQLSSGASSSFSLPDWLLPLTKGPLEELKLSTGASVRGVWNVPASLVGLICGSVLYRGITTSAWVNNVIVFIKVAIICTFIVLGIGLVNPANLYVNPNAPGLLSLVPLPEMVDGAWRYGWGIGGVLTAAGVVFFAYIGFDAVSTAAQETRRPSHDLPIGILGSLFICTLLYILVAFTLTGVVHYRELGVPAPIAVGINRIVELRGWNPNAAGVFTLLIKLGAIAGLTSVILVMMLGQSRIFYAMARDGLLPWFDRTHPRFQTPHIATVVTTAFVCLAGGALPIDVVGELVSIGTLLAFVLVCIGVPILRVTNPDHPRSFQVPMPWVVGPLGALVCLVVMWGLPAQTWYRLLMWLAVGMVIYFTYGRRQSFLQREKQA